MYAIQREGVSVPTEDWEVWKKCEEGEKCDMERERLTQCTSAQDCQLAL